MERSIDFARERQMLCRGCGRQFIVDPDWVDRWDQQEEECPGCGLTCEHEDAPKVTVDPDDPALDDDRVARFFWYHTSTQPDWPSTDFDPAAAFTSMTRERMGGEDRVAAWVARQHAKALHVGTYEAAVQNMLRRMRNQGDHRSQFYLYRVHLEQFVAVREGWLIDPSNFVGDVVLAEVCPPGVDVARYLNYHEDPGGLSLALGREAVATVQQVPIPLPDAGDDAREDAWVREAVVALASVSDDPVAAPGRWSRFMPRSSPRAVLGRELGTAVAGKLPVTLQDQFESAVAFDEGDDPASWARWASGLFDLIVDPQRALAMLDRQEHRVV